MIAKRKDGYYVLSKKPPARGADRPGGTRRNLGGPYKTRAEAVKRLRQVEFFKRPPALRVQRPGGVKKG